MKRKLFTLLLIIATGFGTLFAESGTCGEDITWDLTDGVLTISGTGAMTDFVYDFNTSATTAPWYPQLSSVHTINISEGVTHIGEEAFDGGENVQSISIPQSVTSIGAWAFQACKSLTTFSISDNVTTIGDGIFYDCTGLTTPIYNSHTFICLPTSYSGSYEIPSGITTIAGFAFNECSALTSVNIPDDVTTIGQDAFYGCSSLTSVTIPENVTSIGQGGTFQNCTALTSVQWNAINCQIEPIDETQTDYYPPFYNLSNISDFIFGEKVESIPACLCYGLSGLTSIDIPNTVTNIGFDAFVGCSSLTFVVVPESVVSIGKGGAFQNCTALTSVQWNAINCQVEPYNDIDNYYPPFWNLSNISNFVFGEKVETIPAGVCYGLSGLTSVVIPNSVTNIEYAAFEGCSSLTSIAVPENVVSVGKGRTFLNCNALTSVQWNAINCQIEPYNEKGNYYPPFWNLTNIANFIFGEKVESIPVFLCYGLSGLTSINIPNSVTSIGYEAFAGCSSLTSVVVPENVVSIGKGYTFQNCTALTSVQWNAINCQLEPIDETLTNYFSPFYNLSNISDFIFGEKVESIPASLCCGLSGLTSIDIPSTVTTIGFEAFVGCSSLTSVVVPENVVSIGKGCTFQNCSALTSVQWNAIKCHIDSIDEIGNYYPPFMNLSGITSFDFGEKVERIPASLCYGLSGLTSINIPDSVTKIGFMAFDGCSSLTSVSIPESVVSLGKGGTFQNCDALTSVQWNAIKCHIDSMDAVGNYSPPFFNLSGITSFKFGEKVERIPACLCHGLSGLSSVNMPVTVTRVGNEAFYGCSGLTNLLCEAVNAPILGNSVFVGVDHSIPLYVPEESIELYQQAEGWRDFWNILAIPGTGVGEVIMGGYHSSKVQQVIRNGQIFILSGDKTYTVQGQEVR